VLTPAPSHPRPRLLPPPQTTLEDAFRLYAEEVERSFEAADAALAAQLTDLRAASSSHKKIAKTFGALLCQLLQEQPADQGDDDDDEDIDEDDGETGERAGATRVE
jgi:hypothetical protein